MRWKSIFAVLAMTVVSGGVHAQNGPSGVVTFPESIQATAGVSFDFIVRVDTTSLEGGLNMLGLVVESDPSGVRMTSWSAGKSLMAHVEATGQPPRCDVEFDPDAGTMFSFMFLEVPFDSSVYGTEWLKITMEAPAEGDFEIRVMGESDMVEPIESTIPVSVGPSVSMLEFQRGDVNTDRVCNISDAITILDYLFRGGTVLSCHDAADVDDNGSIQLTDAVVLLGSLFLGGQRMDETCRRDASFDSLSCESSTCI